MNDFPKRKTRLLSQVPDSIGLEESLTCVSVVLDEVLDDIHVPISASNVERRVASCVSDIHLLILK